ncbi:hypothetical protein pdam_00013033, partial [Pocillopora damicornis]
RIEFTLRRAKRIRTLPRNVVREREKFRATRNIAKLNDTMIERRCSFWPRCCTSIILRENPTKPDLTRSSTREIKAKINLNPFEQSAPERFLEASSIGIEKLANGLFIPKSTTTVDE